MRFAYIDSQGNEVAIPSVDALALRIELGAVTGETQLYDASTDRWAPAGTHEIFHALSRDMAGEEEPIVPARPIVPRDQSPPEPRSAQAPTQPPPVDAGPPSEESEPPPGATEPYPRGTQPRDRPSPGLDELGLDLTPPPSGGEESSPPGEGPETTGEGMDLSGPLSPEAGPPTGPGELDDGDALPEFRPDFGLEPASGDGPADLAPAPDDSESADGPLELEPPLDAGGHGRAGFDFGGPLDLEPPMSEFDPSAPPAWMEQEGPETAGDEPVLDFTPDRSGGDPVGAGPVPGSRAASAASPASRGPYAAPRRKGAPTPPRRRARRSAGVRRALLGVLLIAVVGVGGWYGRNVLNERFAPPPPRPEVQLPPLPERLEGPLREIAGRALPSTFDAIEARAFPQDSPREPGDEWLAGVYLANASDYGQVREFWELVRDFTGRLRTEEQATFHDTYRQMADSASVDASDLPLLVQRADSGFLATREERWAVYDLLEDVADAALTLHEFLLANEAEIRYTPATGFGGNPVEEAVPATEAVGAAMWDRVEDITNALDALGTLDRVTLERLSTVLRERVEAVGIR